MDQLPRLGKRELICLLSFTCNYVVFVWRGFLFLWVLGMGYVILLWHSLSLPYNYFLDEKEVETLDLAARLADDYSLTHKASFLNEPFPRKPFNPQSKFTPQSRLFSPQSKPYSP